MQIKFHEHVKHVSREKPSLNMCPINPKETQFNKISFVVFSLNSSFSVTQSAFTCSKLTIETLEQGLKYFQS